MINKINKLLFPFVALSVILFTACNKDEKTLPDYYYHNFAYLEGRLGSDQAVEITGENNAWNVDIKRDTFVVNVKLKTATCCDVTVHLAVDTTLVDQENYKVIDPKYYSHAATVVIPAGETSVQTVVRIVDKGFLKNTEKKTTWQIPITISEIESNSEISISSNRNVVYMPITLPAFTNYRYAIPTSGAKLDRSTWPEKYIVSDGEAYGAAALFDGDKGTYLYFGGSTLYTVIVDMGGIKDVTGIQTWAVYDVYSVATANIYTSEDGEEWTLFTKADGYSVLQDQGIEFGSLPARWLKYEVIKSGTSGLALCEFDVYAR